MSGPTGFPAFSLRHVARTSSTQDVVRRAAVAGAPEGFCCTADEQTAGRGRQGRTWEARPGTALLASVLLRRSPEVVPGIPFAAGLAVLDGLASTTVISAALKWPNDVVLRGRKLAGILCEVQPAPSTGTEYAVAVGLGLNLDAGAATAGSISVGDVCAPPPPRVLLAGWLEGLAARLRVLEEEGMPALLEAWRSQAVGIGEPVRAQGPSGEVSGVATGVDDTGALLVASPSGVTRLLAADVHLTSASA